MIIFTDIDDTIMQTKRKIPVAELSHCIIGADDKNNAPLSYITSKRQKLLNELFLTQTTIPVTARSRNGFSKLKINFKHQAILNFGATILDEHGHDYHEWNDFIKKESILLKQDQFFSYVKNRLSQDKFLKEHVDFNIRKDNELSVYFSIILKDKNNNVLGTEVIKNRMVQELKLEDYYVYQTPREVAILPNFVRKELGVKFLIDKFYPNELLIGAGDHKNDFAFMNLCDFALLPNDSSLSKTLKEI